ncbi:MAG: ABC transporter permease [Verrucomicrobia bacterium]|nr:ABC transporter permease [Verrucomicrobiota bacterium]
MKQRIIALIIKELLVNLKDKKVCLSLIVPPIIQLVIFTWAATLDVKDVPIGILNRDSGEKAFELVQRFHGSPMFTKIVYLKGVEEIAPFIDNQWGVMVVSIDEQFSRNIDAKKAADVQLILDGRKTNTAQIVAGYTSDVISQYNLDIASDIGVKLQSTAIVPRDWYNPNLLFYWYNIPCLVAILTMLLSLIITCLSVARERELGTFDQLLVSPMLPIEIMIGKVIPAIIIALVESTIIVLVGVFIFQVPFVSYFAYLYAALFVFVCSVVGVGLFISSLCSTQQQAVLGSFCFVSPSVLLSGFATPIENMAPWIQYITYVNPLRYMLVVSRGVFLKDMPFSIILQNLWPMAIIAIFTFTASTWFFKRRLE